MKATGVEPEVPTEQFDNMDIPLAVTEENNETVLQLQSNTPEPKKRVAKSAKFSPKSNSNVAANGPAVTVTDHITQPDTANSDETIVTYSEPDITDIPQKVSSKKRPKKRSKGAKSRKSSVATGCVDNSQLDPNSGPTEDVNQCAQNRGDGLNVDERQPYPQEISPAPSTNIGLVGELDETVVRPTAALSSVSKDVSQIMYSEDTDSPSMKNSMVGSRSNYELSSAGLHLSSFKSQSMEAVDVDSDDMNTQLKPRPVSEFIPSSNDDFQNTSADNVVNIQRKENEVKLPMKKSGTTSHQILRSITKHFYNKSTKEQAKKTPPDRRSLGIVEEPKEVAPPPSAAPTPAPIEEGDGPPLVPPRAPRAAFIHTPHPASNSPPTLVRATTTRATTRVSTVVPSEPDEVPEELDIPIPAIGQRKSHRDDSTRDSVFADQLYNELDEYISNRMSDHLDTPGIMKDVFSLSPHGDHDKGMLTRPPTVVRRSSPPLRNSSTSSHQYEDIIAEGLSPKSHVVPNTPATPPPLPPPRRADVKSCMIERPKNNLHPVNRTTVRRKNIGTQAAPVHQQHVIPTNAPLPRPSPPPPPPPRPCHRSSPTNQTGSKPRPPLIGQESEYLSILPDSGNDYLPMIKSVSSMSSSIDRRSAIESVIEEDAYGSFPTVEATDSYGPIPAADSYGSTATPTDSYKSTDSYRPMSMAQSTVSHRPMSTAKSTDSSRPMSTPSSTDSCRQFPFFSSDSTNSYRPVTTTYAPDLQEQLGTIDESDSGVGTLTGTTPGIILPPSESSNSVDSDSDSSSLGSEFSGDVSRMNSSGVGSSASDSRPNSWISDLPSEYLWMGGSFTSLPAVSEDDNSTVKASAFTLEHDESRKRKLLCAVQEIESSEKSFIKTLMLLNEEFKSFLNGASQRLGGEIIPTDDFKAIFRDLPELQRLNECLLAEISERIKHWDERPQIADIFIKTGPFLKLYSVYIMEFEVRCATFDEARRKFPEFDKVVKSFESTSTCQKLTLKHYMLKPVQRLPQYRLLLQGYKKYLHQGSPDYRDIDNALRIVTEVSEHANQQMKYEENLKKLLDIQNHLIGSFELIKPGRALLKDGTLQKWCRKGMQPRHFHLLTDILLYTTPVGSGLYKLNNALPLAGMKIQIPEKNDLNHEFSIVTRQRSFAVHAENFQERTDWMTALQNAIDVCDENAKSYQESNSSVEDDLKDDNMASLSLGSSAPVWIPDSRVSMCMICTAEFTLMFRRHHCRACGRVVCSFCSQYRAPLQYLGNQPAKVCRKCYHKLKKEVRRKSSQSLIVTSSSGNEPSAQMDQLMPLFSKSSPVRVSLQKFGGKNLQRMSHVGEMLGFKPKKKSSVLKEVKAADDSAMVSGYLKLWKEKKWVKGWYVLKGHVLYNFKGIEDTAASSSKVLLGYHVQQNSTYFQGVKPEFVFVLRHANLPDEIYRCDDSTTSIKWLNALFRASQTEA